MGRDLDLDDVAAQHPEAKRELERLREDLAAARAGKEAAIRLWEESNEGYADLRAQLAAAQKRVAELTDERDNTRRIAGYDWDFLEAQAQSIRELQADLAAAKRWHEQSSEQWRVAVGEAVQRAERAEADLAAARALLLEARMRIWHTCGSEGESKCLSHRIDAALAGEKK